MARARRQVVLDLPEETIAILDGTSARTLRSASELVHDAVQRQYGAGRDHAAAPVVEDTDCRLAFFQSLAGAGVSRDKPMTGDEINAHIAWLRGDD